RKEKFMTKYKVLPGPESYLPPAAAMHGVCLPKPGEGFIEGECYPVEEAITFIAKKMLSAKNPTFFPGPLLLWRTTPYALERGKLVVEIAKEINAKIIPMPDYRPKYPMINPEVEINPNHPNLTIWHNKIDLAIFIGVHCHFANMALKIIRGGTDCYTIALCAEEGHEEANASLRDCTNEVLKKLLDEIKKLKKV
ncbi:MAG: carbon monoxide dehydrogenase beta subunit family protein, partial [Elusimicrobiota bacterium]|nr:carbon monoxide dehydrogenase beta subunit family protein [Elusimicrobiota bacterium]